jgi:hypothetical protein
MTSICNESNFEIKSSYNKAFFSSSEMKAKNKNISMYNTSIFIGGRQNLKSKRIHLASSAQFNNHIHREIQNFRNKKPKSVDKINIYLNKSENGEQKIEQIDIINMMNIRWQNNLQETRSDLSYIKIQEKKEPEKKSNLIDINKYIQELIDKININYDFTEINNKTDNQEYFVLLKSDNYNQKNNIIHEIISPKSIEDLEKSVQNFMKRPCSKINKDNNTDSSSSIELNKKKKILNQKENIDNINLINDNQENINDNVLPNENEFCPVFILSQKDIRNLYEIIEPQKTNRNKNINYTINNFSFNYESIIDKNAILPSENNNNILENEKAKNEENNEKQEKEEEKIWLLEQINVEKFELISSNRNDKPENSNENENLIAVNDSQNLQNNNQINPEETYQIKSEINIELISEKNIQISDPKISTEDFSQNTPISLLQDKFSVYAVSKWIKFSVPHPQKELIIKSKDMSNSFIAYKESSNLLITNFTLWIERIETKRNDNNKCSISINSSTNSKNNSNKRGKSLTYNKSRHTHTKMNKGNNYEMGVNGTFIKPINLKSKVFK